MHPSYLRAEEIAVSTQIVECMGLPGAGKTYFCAALSADLQALGERVSTDSMRIGALSPPRRIGRKMWLCAEALLFWPATTRAFIHWIWCQDLPRARSLNLIINAMSVLPLYRKTDQIIVLDQGLVQIAWAVLHYLLQRDKYLIEGAQFRDLLEQVYGLRRVHLVNVCARQGWHEKKLSARENWTAAQCTQWRAGLARQENAQRALWTLLSPLLEPEGDVRVAHLENRRDTDDDAA